MMAALPAATLTNTDRRRLHASGGDLDDTDASDNDPERSSD